MFVSLQLCGTQIF